MASHPCLRAAQAALRSDRYLLNVENERVGPEKGKPPATAGRKAPGLLEVGREVAELPKDPSRPGSVPHGTRESGGSTWPGKTAAGGS